MSTDQRGWHILSATFLYGMHVQNSWEGGGGGIHRNAANSSSLAAQHATSLETRTSSTSGFSNAMKWRAFTPQDSKRKPRSKIGLRWCFAAPFTHDGAIPQPHRSQLNVEVLSQGSTQDPTSTYSGLSRAAETGELPA